MLTNVRVGSSVGGFIRNHEDISQRALVESGTEAGGMADMIISAIVKTPEVAIEARRDALEIASQALAKLNTDMINSVLIKLGLGTHIFSDDKKIRIPQYIADIVLKITKDQLIVLGHTLDEIVQAPQARNLVSNASIVTRIN